MMKQIVSAFLLALTSFPAFADDDVAALVVDNGVSLPEPSSLVLLATGVAVLGLKLHRDRRRKQNRRQ